MDNGKKIKQSYVAGVIQALEPVTSHDLMHILYVLYKIGETDLYLGYSSCGLKIKSKELGGIIRTLTQEKVIQPPFYNPSLYEVVEPASPTITPVTISTEVRALTHTVFLETVAILLYYGGTDKYDRITPEHHRNIPEAVEAIKNILK